MYSQGCTLCASGTEFIKLWNIPVVCLKNLWHIHQYNVRDLDPVPVMGVREGCPYVLARNEKETFWKSYPVKFHTPDSYWVTEWQNVKVFLRDFLGQLSSSGCWGILVLWDVNRCYSKQGSNKVSLGNSRLSKTKLICRLQDLELWCVAALWNLRGRWRLQNETWCPVLGSLSKD